MFWKWLKRYMPHGLYGRAALILLVPIISIQLVVSVIFIQRHFNRVTEQMTSAVVLELSYLVDEVRAAPNLAGARAVIGQLQAPLDLTVILPAGAPLSDAKSFDDLTGGRVMRVLHAGLQGLTGVDLASLPRRVALSFDTPHGVMVVTFPRARVSASNPHQLLVIMVLFSMLMTLIAYFFLRNQLRPIARLSRAAEAFGKGQVVPYRVSGATEVRAAGRTFLDMRARIERQIEQRTLILSGVSHDLRTPLTRLKLGLSMLDDSPERAALEQDVTDMERLVDEFLNFARAANPDEAPEPVDPGALVRQVAENAARMGLDVEIGPVSGPDEMALRPVPVVRALENLISNATRYGSRARISLEQVANLVKFVVEDDGPGIARERREEAMKPFTRLDQARNQDRGSGVGLGLAIAADIARFHGGRLALGDSADLGGLRAEFIVPI